jgi:WD40 repeat protein
LHQLTYTNDDKLGPLMTDGNRIYFKSQDRTVQMSVKGGASSPLEAPIGVRDIVDVSADGSEFLLRGSDLHDETSRGTLWRMPILGGPPKRLGNLTGRGAAYSPDGKSIAIAELNSLYVADLNGEHSKEIWSPGRTVDGWPHYSPDGSAISVTSDAAAGNQHYLIWQIKPDGGNPHPVISDWPENVSLWDGVWTPNGKHFVFRSDRGGHDAIYELLQPRWFEFWKKPRAVKLTAEQPEIGEMTPARDSTGLFFIGRVSQGAMYYYDEKEKHFFPFLDGLAASVFVISPDRQWMVYSDYPRGFLWRCRLDGSQKLQLTDSPAHMPAWSPDSQYIAYSDWQELYRVGVSGSAPEKLTSEGAGEVLPSWSPDGKSIYFNDYPDPGVPLRIRVLDLQTRKVSTMPGSEGYYAPSWSPDGQYLAGIRNSETLAIYSPKTGKWTPLKTFKRDWDFFTWAPDSKSICVARRPQSVAEDEIPGIYRVTIPDARWDLVTKYSGIKPPNGGSTANFVAFTPDGHIATMNDTSFSQIYEITWPATN